MRSYLALLAGALTAVCLAGSLPADATTPATQPAATEPGFAVVELFTSEGCSSCPPADELLSRIVRAAGQQHRRVYALAYHVDYFNAPWIDPFSKAEFTRRQGGYCGLMGLKEVYTPQMIVNGRTQFLGSDARTAQQQISDALRHIYPVRLSAQVTRASDPTKESDALLVSLQGAHVPTGCVFCAALVEGGLTVQVPCGENQGRTLHHENVVRDFQFTTPNDQQAGSIKLAVAKDMKLQNASIICFAQDTKTGQMFAATECQPDVTAPSNPSSGTPGEGRVGVHSHS